MDALRRTCAAAATTRRRGIEEMDRDGVDAEVLYPTPRLAQGVVANTDAAFHLALVRAYNDWLSDYVAHAPDRFGGLALLPNRGAEHAVAEIDRVWGRPGIRGVLLGCYPNGTLEPRGEDDAVWARLAEAGIPVEHPRQPLAAHAGRAPRAAARLRPVLRRARTGSCRLIFAGVFDRFPALDVVVAEVDCGWVPYFKEQIDNNYRRLAPVSDFRITALPSEYVERHVHFTYLTDEFGIAQRGEHRRRAHPLVERLPAHLERLAASRGRRSTPRSPASPRPSATRSSPATRNASTASEPARRGRA